MDTITYNMSNIMSLAHTIKQDGLTMSEALKCAWAFAKHQKEVLVGQVPTWMPALVVVDTVFHTATNGKHLELGNMPSGKPCVRECNTCDANEACDVQEEIVLDLAEGASMIVGRAKLVKEDYGYNVYYGTSALEYVSICTHEVERHTVEGIVEALQAVVNEFEKKGWSSLVKSDKVAIDAMNYVVEDADVAFLESLSMDNGL